MLLTHTKSLNLTVSESLSSSNRICKLDAACTCIHLAFQLESSFSPVLCFSVCSQANSSFGIPKVSLGRTHTHTHTVSCYRLLGLEFAFFFLAEVAKLGEQQQKQEQMELVSHVD